jgi:hypothetical protein
MGRTVKNLTLCVGVRETSRKAKYSKFTLPLEKLAQISLLEKHQQPLVQYNFKVLRGRDPDRGFPCCRFTTLPSQQTVIVLDFDDAKDPFIQKTVTDTLWAEFGITPILESTQKGFHVIIPFDRMVKDEAVYVFLVDALVSVLPQWVMEFFDRNASRSRSRFWYHSRFFDKWVNKGFLNITETQQRGDRFFSDLSVVSVEQIYSIFSKHMYALETVTDEVLLYMFNFTMNFLHGGLKCGPETLAAAAEFLYRILVETNGRRGCSELLSTIRSRAEEIQRSSEGHFFSCEPHAGIRQIERLFSVDGQLAHRNFRRGSTGNNDAHAGSTEAHDVFCVSSHSEEGNGNILGHSIRHATCATRGLPDHSSVERVLAFVSEFLSVLGWQQLTINSMGYFVSKDSLRSNEHRSYQPKEQDYLVFDGVCRQILEDYYGQFGADAPAYVRLYEWFRHTSRYMGNLQHGGRLLSAIGNEILRGMRLSDARLGLGRLQEIKRQDANRIKFDFANEEEIDTVWMSFFDAGWRERVSNEKYAERIVSFSRNNPEKIRDGMRNMFGWFAKMRNKTMYDTVDIGNDLFEHWFGSRELSAYLRRLVLHKIASMAEEYVPMVKPKSWLFLHDFISVWAGRFEAFSARFFSMSAEKLADKLGNGMTFNTVRSMVPLMFARWGGDTQRVLDVFNKALDLSSANQIESRKRSLVSYLRKIELDYHKGTLRLAEQFT